MGPHTPETMGGREERAGILLLELIQGSSCSQNYPMGYSFEDMADIFAVVWENTTQLKLLGG